MLSHCCSKQFLLDFMSEFDQNFDRNQSRYQKGANEKGAKMLEPIVTHAYLIWGHLIHQCGIDGSNYDEDIEGKIQE